MRIEIPREAERFGANHIYGLQKVYEFDSGPHHEASGDEDSVIQRLSYEQLYEIEKEMAIVVPIRDEKLKLLEGVLFGIPHHCLVIVVSNSKREPVDRFTMEHKALEVLARFTRKRLLHLHQKDPVLSDALARAGYDYLLDEDGLVRDGKAEGMIVATLLACLAGKRYVGFIDADNYFPGAVHEYIKEYAAGFALSNSDYSMVRIAWNSKPKIVRSHLYFAKWGRTSVVTNHFLNKLVSHYTGFGTEVIKTGNAGEHAMTMDLALQLDYATGYAIEPYHYINLWERYGGVVGSLSSDIILRHVEIFQIESRNPHLHEAKGEAHVDQMILAALQTIYHSPICPEELKREIVQELRERGILGPGDPVPEGTYYPSLHRVDLETLRKALCNEPYAPLLERSSRPDAPPLPQAAPAGRETLENGHPGDTGDELPEEAAAPALENGKTDAPPA
ncbi:MAG: mannosyl-3-phosphoglycerate synthase [Rhodothermaceae bacterium]|nr:MAG: mannosyl-3-phosphoglycerate synthase [Rhodothermaceae bacterium]